MSGLDGRTRLIVAVSEQQLRNGLPAYVARDGAMSVVAQADTAPQACEKARHARADVALVGLDLPEGGGLAVARMLAQERPQMRVALIARAFTQDDLREGMRAGVSGYITKDVSVGTLMDALHCVARGDAFATSSASTLLVGELARCTSPADAHAGNGARPDREIRAKVTDRERDVLRLIVQGATNRDIAEQLLITENTVKVHLRNILDKLHLRNRQQAAAFAVSTGLVALRTDGKVRHARAADRPGHRNPGAWRRRELVR